MIIKLLNTGDEKNKLNKKYDIVEEINGDIKEELDVLNPVFIVKLDKFPNCNYAYIPDFSRYYFANVSVLCEGLYRIKLSVDVLMSYKSSISKLCVILDKQELTKNSNQYINDGSFVVENKSYNEIAEFKFGFNDDPSYILVTAGA